MIHNRQLFGAVNQVQSYEKNVIGGAMLDNVFQHKLTVSEKTILPENSQKRKRTPTQSVQVSSFLLD